MTETLPPGMIDITAEIEAKHQASEKPHKFKPNGQDHHPGESRNNDHSNSQPISGRQQSNRRFKPVRFKDVQFVAASQDLIKGLFPRNGLVVVWGPPKCGKSFWVYDAAMHVALGKFYRKRRVLQGCVVYIACEGERGLKAQTEAYRQTLPDDADPPFYLLTTQLDLVADVGNLIADIHDGIGRDAPILIVVDTLNRSLNGSENKPEDMTAYIRAADKIRETFSGSSVALIHHCGIDGTRPRGFTGLSAAADAQIRTERDAAKNIVATVEFMKDGDEGESIVSKLHVVEIGADEYGDIITSCVVEPAEATEPQTKERRLSKSSQRALKLLGDAIDKAGEIPPEAGNGKIPPHNRCVHQQLWREYCRRGGISKGEDRAQNLAFQRAGEDLLTAKQIDTWDDLVWLL